MDRLKVLRNVKDIKNYGESATYRAEGFDLVTTNPPYMESGRDACERIQQRAITRHELLAGA